MSKRNQSMEVLTAIEAALAKECGEMQMSDPDARVEMAWWIYKNFVQGDFPRKAAERKTIHLSDKKETS